MPYMEALTLESIRMFMGRTFSIPHRALRDTKLLGYEIPKDTMVIANFNCVLMDKQFWKDPEIFRPDRFLDEKGKLNVPDQYLPFGFGESFIFPLSAQMSSRCSSTVFLILQVNIDAWERY